MRTFIAIKLPNEIKNAIADLQEELKKENKNVKWVEPQNVHLTLKFIGNVEEEQIKVISIIINSIIKKITPFGISISGIGAFPNPMRPRVLWVGIKEGKENLICIMENLNNELEKIGIHKEEKNLSPHITIGRIKIGKINIENKKINEYKFNVDRIYLIQSTLTSSGPIYTDIKEFTLIP